MIALRFKKIINNSKGQMAIFVALIFQILFVLFAMTINIGLVVHDKINLQNAVDLAAFYGAQKQAEWLNVVAHQNYQIRQSWKLFSFRYRVLGGMGVLDPPHPGRLNNQNHPDSPYAYGNQATACIYFHPTWPNSPPEDNFCQTPDFSVIAPPKELSVIIDFTGLNYLLQKMTQKFYANFANACTNQGGANWYYAAKIKMAFRLDQRNRLRTIFSELENLKQNNFYELDGGDVKTGIINTFKKNLTKANNDSIIGFQIFNSLSATTAANMLHVNRVIPNMVYTDQSLTSGVCKAIRTPTTSEPAAPGSVAFITAQQDYPSLSAWTTQGEPAENSTDYFYNSLGVEKNPWVMAYMGVKAKTAPKQVFSPFGPVQLEARAFAKPFGGTIGPWFQNSWSRSSDMSDGTDPVDSNLPPRANRLMQLNSAPDPQRMPNYSRYPGDRLGLKSQLALGSFKTNLYAGAALDLQHFYQINQGYSDGNHNDILAYDNENGHNAPVRKWELASIAPDLFDITYYSIMPHYSSTVLGKLQNLKTSIVMFPNIPLRGDLGSRNKKGLVNVDQHIETVNLHRSDSAYYYVQDEQHLFTAWSPNNFNDYSFPDQYFAKCTKYDHGYKVDKIPNGCIIGGRSGYSVKLVSKSYLTSKLSLGNSEQEDQILNLPPEGF